MTYLTANLSVPYSAKMTIENSYSSGIKIFKSGIFAICSHKIILLNVFTKPPENNGSVEPIYE